MVRPDGYVRFSDLHRSHDIANLQPTVEEILGEVRDNAKRRFEAIRDEYGEYWIRATQGHSIGDVRLDLLCGDPVMQLRPGEVCCHGTYERLVPSILDRGLLAGGLQGQGHRRDIHFGTRHPGVEV